MSSTNILDNVKKLLQDQPNEKVSTYLIHIKDLYDDPKTEWIRSQPPKVLSTLFKTTLDQTGLFIDGDMVRLNFIFGKKKKITVDFDYRAYKNRVLHKYPNAIFDHQIVYKGDCFSFKKSSGKIIYTHEFNNPFANGKEIIGAYCIVKTNFGDFIEIINDDEIQKIRSTAKTKYIWDNWYSRMVLKSIIKRACSVHFKDIVRAIDKIDNENTQIGISPDDFIEDNPPKIKVEPKEDKPKLPFIKENRFNDLIIAVRDDGYNPDEARKVYSFTEDQEKVLLDLQKAKV